MSLPKINSWFEVNPRGNLWRNDHSRFGHKMLLKMGWQENKGLGKNENGVLEVKLDSVKQDNRGVGWKPTLVAVDTKEYDDVLAKLNKVYSTPDTPKNSEQFESIEKRSQQFKNRLHYQKLVKGKDVGRYSQKDMDCIFISKKKEKVAPIENGRNMVDYFASKIKTKSEIAAADGPDRTNSNDVELMTDECSPPCNDSEKEQNSARKSKKRKKNDGTGFPVETMSLSAGRSDQVDCSELAFGDKYDSSSVNGLRTNDGLEDAPQKLKRRKKSVIKETAADKNPAALPDSEEIEPNLEKTSSDAGGSIRTVLGGLEWGEKVSGKIRKFKKSKIPLKEDSAIQSDCKVLDDEEPPLLQPLPNTENQPEVATRKSKKRKRSDKVDSAVDSALLNDSEGLDLSPMTANPDEKTAFQSISADNHGAEPAESGSNRPFPDTDEAISTENKPENASQKSKKRKKSEKRASVIEHDSTSLNESISDPALMTADAEESATSTPTGTATSNPEESVAFQSNSDDHEAELVESGSDRLIPHTDHFSRNEAGSSSRKSKKRKKSDKRESTVEHDQTSLDESNEALARTPGADETATRTPIGIKSCLKSTVDSSGDKRRRVSFKRKFYRRDIDEDSNVTDSKHKVKDPDPSKMPYWKVGFLRKYLEFASEDADPIIARLFATEAAAIALASCPSDVSNQAESFPERAESFPEIAGPYPERAERDTSRGETPDEDEIVDVDGEEDSVCAEINVSFDEKKRTSSSDVSSGDKKQTGSISTESVPSDGDRKQSNRVSTENVSSDDKKKTNNTSINTAPTEDSKQSISIVKKQACDIITNIAYANDKEGRNESLSNAICEDEWEPLKINNTANGAWQESQKIAMKMDKYKKMKNKLKTHPVLKNTNMCCIKGYGNWGL